MSIEPPPPFDDRPRARRTPGARPTGGSYPGPARPNRPEGRVGPAPGSPEEIARRRELARRRAIARRRRKAQIRRNRLVAGTVTGLLLAVSLLLALSGQGTGQPASANPVPAPRPHLRSLVSSRLVVPGKAPSLTWPSQGEGAVSVFGVGLMAASPVQRVVPIASLTKMMTAYVLLHDHPLAPGQAGPVLVMTKTDVAAYVRAVQADDSNVPVRAGEHLSEHQLLEALLVPSADNVADLLGAWDAGTDKAFVAKMNATAHHLGLVHTHYADASGVDPRSRSTAADQARLAAKLMAIPVVRSIVRHPSLPFPVAGTITNYNPALGTSGIIGVKSGFTSQAQGCLATAAFRHVGGHSALVITVSLGQPNGLYGAASSDEQLLAEASRALEAVRVAPAARPLASVSLAWSSLRTTARAKGKAVTAIGWPGLVLRRRVVAGRLPAASPATSPARHAVVGTLAVLAPAGQVASVPLVARQQLPSVPAGWTPAS